MNELIKSIDRIIFEVEKFRRDHYICDEDCWYSCPRSGDCCNENLNADQCICGADNNNNKVDEIKEKLRQVKEKLGG